MGQDLANSNNGGRAMNKPTVLLEGDSLLMDSVAALLQSDEGLEVRRFGKASDRLQPQEINPPAIVLFDLDRIEAGLLLKFLTENPGPALIGLSLAGNKVLLLSRELRTVATHEELQAIIMEQLRKEA
jgi:hypothetical protein